MGATYTWTIPLPEPIPFPPTMQVRREFEVGSPATGVVVSLIPAQSTQGMVTPVLDSAFEASRKFGKLPEVEISSRSAEVRGDITLVHAVAEFQADPIPNLVDVLSETFDAAMEFIRAESR